eukprot:m51a1_g10982 hypothetical protein (602) ;mRNA; f:309109-314472
MKLEKGTIIIQQWRASPAGPCVLRAYDECDEDAVWAAISSALASGATVASQLEAAVTKLVDARKEIRRLKAEAGKAARGSVQRIADEAEEYRVFMAAERAAFAQQRAQFEEEAAQRSEELDRREKQLKKDLEEFRAATEELAAVRRDRQGEYDHAQAELRSIQDEIDALQAERSSLAQQLEALQQQQEQQQQQQQQQARLMAQPRVVETQLISPIVPSLRPSLLALCDPLKKQEATESLLLSTSTSLTDAPDTTPNKTPTLSRHCLEAHQVATPRARPSESVRAWVATSTPPPPGHYHRHNRNKGDQAGMWDHFSPSPSPVHSSFRQVAPVATPQRSVTPMSSARKHPALSSTPRKCNEVPLDYFGICPPAAQGMTALALFTWRKIGVQPLQVVDPFAEVRGVQRAKIWGSKERHMVHPTSSHVLFLYRTSNGDSPSLRSFKVRHNREDTFMKVPLPSAERVALGKPGKHFWFTLDYTATAPHADVAEFIADFDAPNIVEEAVLIHISKSFKRAISSIASSLRKESAIRTWVSPEGGGPQSSKATPGVTEKQLESAAQDFLLQTAAIHQLLVPRRLFVDKIEEEEKENSTGLNDSATAKIM